MSMTATTPTLIKTKAETALADEFARVAASLPGGAGVQASRRTAMAKFAATGLPHRRIEEWKYTDLRSLLKDVHPSAAKSSDAAIAAVVAQVTKGIDAATFVFVGGQLLTSADAVPAGIKVDSFAASLATGADAVTDAASANIDIGAAGIVALNSAFASDGATIEIAANAKPARPVHLVFIATGAATVRNRIVAGAGSEATVIESHVSVASSTRQENTLCEVTVGDGAVLHHASSCVTQAGSLHLGHTIAALGKQAIYKPFQLTVGEGVVRQQFTVTFAGEHTSFDFAAATLARGNGHADTTMVIHHTVPHCTSRELFKTVLDGNGRAIFQGKVIVDKIAQKTDGKQMAKALMLSPTAEFDSKPELEIYADDVACGHGSTCAEINPDMIFYCRSRGIPEAQARALLIDSFVGEAIDKVDSPDVRRAFSEIATTWLAGSPV